MKDRILKLLAAGMKASEISSTVGCSPAYVSQLASDPEFKQKLEALMIQQAETNTEEEHLENRYTSLKHKILNNIEQALPNAELPQLVRALEVVDKVQDNAKAKKLPAPTGNVINGNIHITQISLPAHAVALPAPVVQVNEKNEIIAIDNKPLSPMSSNGVKNIFQQLKDRADAAKLPANVVAEI